MDFLDAFKAAADPFKRSLLRQQQAAQSVDPVAQLRRAYFSRQLQSQVQPSMSQGPLPWDPGTSESMREAYPIEKLPRIDPESQTPLGYITKAVGDVESVLGSPLENVDAPLKGIQQAAIAFHGSPHKFDKFLMSKIGTGEGAQAYGHGLYFAENPAVAKEYMIILGEEKAAPLRRAIQDTEITIKNKKYLEDALAGKVPWPTKPNGEPASIETLKRNISIYDELIKSAEPLKKKLSESAQLYKVDIPDSEIAQMLDWDKPLSEQGGAAGELARRYMGVGESGLPKDMKVTRRPRDGGFMVVQEKGGGKFGPRQFERTSQFDKHETPEAAIRAFWDNMTGADFYRTLSDDLGSGQAASEYMHSLGIPGIKYLDQGSRGAGQGTRNFVKFSDENIKILDINGKPVAPEVAEKFHAPLVKAFSSLAVEDLPKKGTLADFEAVFLSKLDDAGKREWNEWMGEYDPRGFTAEGKYTRDEFVNILQKFNDYAKGMIAGPK